jgi:hypothetical protein
VPERLRSAAPVSVPSVARALGGVAGIRRQSVRRVVLRPLLHRQVAPNQSHRILSAGTLPHRVKQANRTAALTGVGSVRRARSILKAQQLHLPGNRTHARSYRPSHAISQKMLAIYISSRWTDTMPHVPTMLFVTPLIHSQAMVPGPATPGLVVLMNLCSVVTR